MHGSMHVSATHSWKKPGGPEGGLVFEGGIALPCDPCELARSRPADGLRIVPSTKCSFLVLFARNVKRHRVGFENRRDLGEFLTGVGAIKSRLNLVWPGVARCSYATQPASGSFRGVSRLFKRGGAASRQLSFSEAGFLTSTVARAR
jgi:hypothetical protein